MERIRFNHVGRASNLSWPRAIGSVMCSSVLVAIMCGATGCWQKVGLEDDQSAAGFTESSPPATNDTNNSADNSSAITPTPEYMPTPDADDMTQAAVPGEPTGEPTGEAAPTGVGSDQTPLTDLESEDDPFAIDRERVAPSEASSADNADNAIDEQETDTADPRLAGAASAQPAPPDQPLPAEVDADQSATKVPDEPTVDAAGSGDPLDELYYALDPPATASDNQNSARRAESGVDDLADNNAANDLFRNLPPSVLPRTIQRQTPPLPPEPEPSVTLTPAEKPSVGSTAPLPPATTRRAAWLLGSKLSLAALAQDAGAPQEQADGLFAEATTLAEYLDLQLPGMPPLATVRSSGVSQETLDYLLPLARRLGRELDNTRGLDHASLFELAFKSNMLLVLYGPEERVVGAISRAVERATVRAELPPQLAQPILDTLERRPPADVVQQAVFALHRDVYDYLAQQ